MGGVRYVGEGSVAKEGLQLCLSLTQPLRAPGHILHSKPLA